MDDETSRRRSRARFLSTAIGLLVVGVAGYVGFVALARSDRNVSAGVMALAAGTGFAAFFSPCSFPLLLTFLTRRSADSRGAALLSALRVAAGAALLLAAMASLIAVGGVAVGRIVQFDSDLTAGLVCDPETGLC